MRNFKDIGKDLRELLGQRVLMLDGAMGTMLQQRDLTAADFGGATLEGCNEVLVRESRCRRKN
jgi:5-methyltetrahydrofolate--homocysteine methyltransferase